MKSLAELAAIKEKMKQTAAVRDEGEDTVKIVVGMATCGIAAGARAVLNEITAELGKRSLNNVVVAQTGCIGMCKLEPIIDIFKEGEDKITYVLVTPEKVSKIISDHIVNGRPVLEYMIDAN